MNISQMKIIKTLNQSGTKRLGISHHHHQMSFLQLRVSLKMLISVVWPYHLPRRQLSTPAIQSFQSQAHSSGWQTLQCFVPIQSSTLISTRKMRQMKITIVLEKTYRSILQVGTRSGIAQFAEIGSENRKLHQTMEHCQISILIQEVNLDSPNVHL